MTAPRTKQGVLDLNNFGKTWSAADTPLTPEEALRPPKAVDCFGQPEEPFSNSQDTSDLLYEPEPYAAIMAAFPHAKIERDYDEIHGERLSVEIPGLPLRDWYSWLLANKGQGWALISLSFRLTMYKFPTFVHQLMVEAGYYTK